MRRNQDRPQGKAQKSSDVREYALQCYAKIQEMAAATDSLEEPVVQKSLLLISRFPKNKEVIDRQLQMVARLLKPKLAMKQLSPNPFEPNPPRQQSAGQINLGFVKGTENPFGLLLDEIGEHTLISGRSGSGKTTLIYIILAQLAKNNIPFWSFDFKQDYRHISKFTDTLVFNWHNFRFNPLRPPEGVDPKIWMQAFTNVFSQVYWLLSGTKAILLEHIDRLYRDYRVFEGSDVYPSMLDLAECLKQRKLERKYGRETGFWESAKNRLDEVLLSFSGMFDCDKGFSLTELLENNVVFELEGLLTENQSFIINIILRSVFQYRITKGQRGHFRHVFLFDEAKSVFDKNREFTKELGINEVAQFTATIREFGEGLVVSDQMPAKLGDMIKGNVHTVICMSQSGAENIIEMSKALGLSKEQTESLRNLQSDKVGKVFEAVVRMSGRWTQPFVIQMMQLPPELLNKDVDSESVAEFMAPHLERLSSSIVPRTPYQEILTGIKKEEVREAAKQREEFIERTEEKKAVDENQLIQILTNIKEHPFIEQKSRIEMLGLTGSASTVNKLFKELVDRGFVVPHKIGLGRGKGVRILYEMTDAGMKFARIKPFTIPGRSGFPHKFWQHTIKAFYEKQGLKADIEKRLGLKNVDVCVKDGKNLIAVEVELSPDHLIDNIMKDLDSGCNQVVVCCPNKKMMANYRKRVNEHDESLLEKIEFRVLSELIK